MVSMHGDYKVTRTRQLSFSFKLSNHVLCIARFFVIGGTLFYGYQTVFIAAPLYYVISIIQTSF